MEWLTAAWAKINNPLAFLLVSAGLIFFAPPAYLPFAIVAGGVGIAGALQWLVGHAKTAWAWFQQGRFIKQRIATLNPRELAIYRARLATNSQTFYLNWGDYHGHMPELGGRREYTELFGIYQGLAEKGLLQLSTNQEVATLHIPERVWRALQKAQRKNPNF